jgi:hypothetical protein
MASLKPKRVGTLQDLVDQRRSLVLYCRGDQCKAPGRKVDTEAVIRERGNMSLQRFAELSRCAVCGAHEPQTVCAPQNVGPRAPKTPA